MKKPKMSLTAIQERFNKAEMKKIMAGSGAGVGCECKIGHSSGMAGYYTCD